MKNIVFEIKEWRNFWKILSVDWVYIFWILSANQFFNDCEIEMQREKFMQLLVFYIQLNLRFRISGLKIKWDLRLI